MPLPDSAFVRCIYCQRGRNGDQSCSGTAKTTAAAGCFMGRVLPEKKAKNHARNKREFSKLIYPAGMTWEGPVKEKTS
jgi:hypothetical protein